MNWPTWDPDKRPREHIAKDVYFYYSSFGFYYYYTGIPSDFPKATNIAALFFLAIAIPFDFWDHLFCQTTMSWGEQGFLRSGDWPPTFWFRFLWQGGVDCPMATGSKVILWNGTDVRHDRQNWLAIGLHMSPNVATSSGMLASQSLACAQIFWQYITIFCSTCVPKLVYTVTPSAHSRWVSSWHLT